MLTKCGAQTPNWDSPHGLGRFLHTDNMFDDPVSPLAVSTLRELSVHCGTHIDAPSHFIKRAFDKGIGVETLDLEVLNGATQWPSFAQPCLVINQSEHHCLRILANLAQLGSFSSPMTGMLRPLCCYSAGPVLVIEAPHGSNITGWHSLGHLQLRFAVCMGTGAHELKAKPGHGSQMTLAGR